MIDLHTHTNESDGTDSPAELIALAKRSGLEALAITDHDTLGGYDKAREAARVAGLDLLCGIELSTRFEGRTVHLLGYFPNRLPSDSFRKWLKQAQDSRVDRNRRMAERLRSLGVNITLAEVEERGRNMAGRPHFARVLLEKGYVSTLQQAFTDYLDESAPAYVDRKETDFTEAVAKILESGGVPSLAHPIRLLRKKAEPLEKTVTTMRDAGLLAVEVFHSDHSPADVQQYGELARKFGLGITGGSDYHGGNKPNIQIGTGAAGNLNVSRDLLVSLRELAA